MMPNTFPLLVIWPVTAQRMHTKDRVVIIFPNKTVPVYDGRFLVVLSRPEDRRALISSFHASHLVQAIDNVMSLVFSVLDFVPAGSATSISTLQIIWNASHLWWFLFPPANPAPSPCSVTDTDSGFAGSFKGYAESMETDRYDVTAESCTSCSVGVHGCRLSQSVSKKTDYGWQRGDFSTWNKRLPLLHRRPQWAAYVAWWLSGSAGLVQNAGL